MTADYHDPEYVLTDAVADLIPTSMLPVTRDETSAVVAWCRDWAEDCEWADTTPVEVSETAARELLRACDRHIDGGLSFVLADVRRRI
jgi:hypothetical protein